MRKEIRKLHDSFRFAWRGLVLCTRGERNFRVHLCAAVYVTVFALLGRATAQQGAIFCLCFGLTMGAELMNTAVERLCDKHAHGYDGVVRNAKDIAAAAVFVCAAACVGVGLFLFLGEGILFAALAVLRAHLWGAALCVAGVPLCLLFIFQYGRKI